MFVTLFATTWLLQGATGSCLYLELTANPGAVAPSKRGWTLLGPPNGVLDLPGQVRQIPPLARHRAAEPKWSRPGIQLFYTFPSGGTALVRDGEAALFVGGFWRRIKTGPILFAQAHGEELYLVGSTQVLVVTKRGERVLPLPPGSQGEQLYGFDVFGERLVFLTAGHLWLSRDKGKSYRRRVFEGGRRVLLTQDSCRVLTDQGLKPCWGCGGIMGYYRRAWYDGAHLWLASPRALYRVVGGRVQRCDFGLDPLSVQQILPRGLVKTKSGYYRRVSFETKRDVVGLRPAALRCTLPSERREQPPEPGLALPDLQLTFLASSSHFIGVHRRTFWGVTLSLSFTPALGHHHTPPRKMGPKSNWEERRAQRYRECAVARRLLQLLPILKNRTLAALVRIRIEALSSPTP